MLAKLHVTHPWADEQIDGGGGLVGPGLSFGSAMTSRSPTATRTGTVTEAASGATAPGAKAHAAANPGIVTDAQGGSWSVQVGKSVRSRRIRSGWTSSK